MKNSHNKNFKDPNFKGIRCIRIDEANDLCLSGEEESPWVSDNDCKKCPYNDRTKRGCRAVKYVPLHP